MSAITGAVEAGLEEFVRAGCPGDVNDYLDSRGLAHPHINHRPRTNHFTKASYRAIPRTPPRRNGCRTAMAATFSGTARCRTKNHDGRRGFRRALCILLGAATTMLLPLAGLAAAASGDDGALQIVGPSSVTLTTDHTGTETQPTTIKVKNTSTGSITPILSVNLMRGDTPVSGVTAAAPEGTTVPRIKRNSTEELKFVVTGVPADANLTGQLAVSGGKAAPSQISISISPTGATQTYGTSSTFILLASLGAGLVVVTAAFLFLGAFPPKWGPQAGFTDVLAPENFDFSSGFAASTTLIGALLGTIVAASVIPDNTRWLSKDTYIALNIIFGALVPFATAIFNASQKDVKGKLHGRVWSFLIAAWITAWAALGELLTVWFLIKDINGTSGLTGGGNRLILGIVGLGGVITAIYIGRTVAQITNQATPKGQKAQKRSARQKRTDRADEQPASDKVVGLRRPRARPGVL
jgi:hypothetical protein